MLTCAQGSLGTRPEESNEQGGGTGAREEGGGRREGEGQARSASRQLRSNRCKPQIARTVACIRRTERVCVCVGGGVGEGARERYRATTRQIGYSNSLTH